jgi:hypothetical protein
LVRSRDTDVRESELVVFIMPEIIHCADRPNFRQQLVDDTIRCRLDQIPEAEGCPPCCRRLPNDPTLSYPAPLELQQEELPLEEAVEPVDAMPTPEEAEALLPESADMIHSAEFQFGAAGRSQHVRALVAEGQLRRLPGVQSPTPIVAQRFETGTRTHTSTTSSTPAGRPPVQPIRR